jgi:hypothetical protein
LEARLVLVQELVGGRVEQREEQEERVEERLEQIRVGIRRVLAD